MGEERQDALERRSSEPRLRFVVGGVWGCVARDDTAAEGEAPEQITLWRSVWLSCV